MPDSKGLSRRRFLLGVASTAATSCLPLSGAAILTGDLTPALAAQNTTVRESREAVSPAPVIVVNSGYRLLIDSVRGTIASFRSTYGVNRELLIRDHARLPLFNIEFMNDRSEFKLLASTEAKKIAVRKDEHEKDQTVTIEYKEIGELPVDGIVTIRRGYRTKVQHGWLPGLAPLGYLNDKAAKTIIADPERFPLVQQMWRLMLTGAYSPRRIWEIATKDWGLCTVPRKRIGGNPITLSAVYRVLTNSFYAGVLEREGQTFPGKHPPMITLDEFAHVRAVMSRSGRPRQTRSFSYTGMIRCGECGFSVTGEEKVNRFGSHYTYYHCSKRRLDLHCKQPYLALDDLEEQILDFLRQVMLPDRFHQWAVKRLELTMKAKKERHDAQKSSLLRAQATNARELDNLTKLRIRDLITDDEYVKQRQELERQQIGTTQRLEALRRDDARFEPAQSLIEFNKILLSRFTAGDFENKRLIVNIVGSNLVLKDKKLNIDARKPFRKWSPYVENSEMRAFVKDVRTFFWEETSESLEMHSRIQEILKELSASTNAA